MSTLSEPTAAMHPAHSILSRAHSPETASALFEDRVLQKPLPVRPSSPEPSAHAIRQKAAAQRRALVKRRNTLKPRPLSASQKRKLCLYEIPAEQRRYAIYEPLHSLWLEYIREILGLNQSAAGSGRGRASHHLNPSAAGPQLASADMHGALIQVVRSKCVSRVGLRGIVIQDSKFVFDVITPRNLVKSIPKESTAFRITVPIVAQDGLEPPEPIVFEIMGDQFQNRAPDRANKKFKMHYQPYL